MTSILKKVGFTMQLFWIPLLVHGMMLSVSAHLIKKGMIPFSMADWRCALLLSLLILTVLAYRLSNQDREVSVITVFFSAAPWLIWFAASLLYAFVQWHITFLPIGCFLFAAFITYIVPLFIVVIFLLENTFE
ncbi:hypothetical protein [Kosakonia radicincitans]|uniref:hypothetical protein n=1 Tax=Kosakonia radicincitans TaxID=283686 RepID=UPI00236879C9|nr:hypothetical protein [Kosakonia radicincitans]MDD7997485.1 hypothetical protein [Kosakonia radicincitans]